jgi:hypothetical protein
LQLQSRLVLTVFSFARDREDDLDRILESAAKVPAAEAWESLVREDEVARQAAKVAREQAAAAAATAAEIELELEPEPEPKPEGGSGSSAGSSDAKGLRRTASGSPRPTVHQLRRVDSAISEAKAKGKPDPMANVDGLQAAQQQAGGSVTAAGASR